MDTDFSVQLITEIQRGQDTLRVDLVDATKETTAAVRDLGKEIRALRQEQPGRINSWLALGVVLLAIVSMFGLLASKGINVGAVANATTAVMPGSQSTADNTR